eukprot:TRINITY_DN776521_c0_g1_i1.p1 TRINITY_DN776521_c0_g1~~TRINITY_DN776521_c0_g1_i1.p1  ORF type:complete len:223 (+),score=94.67 TRINITY_DN776521_c0_g1_i1:39-671(+)
MAKKFKGQNSRVVKANEIKAVAQAAKNKKAKEAAEAKESADWAVGSNTKAASRKEEQARKAEEKRLRAEEKRLLIEKEDAEAALMKKSRMKGKDKRAVATTRRLDAFTAALDSLTAAPVNASGIDNVLGALDDLAPAKKTEELDRHPERRAKAAYKVWSENMMIELKEDHPGLRQSQYKSKLSKLWKKSPENPMNQEHIAYNFKEEKKAE